MKDRPPIVLVNRLFIIRRREILALQRASTDSHNPGLWEVPGGKLESGQDIHLALAREIHEETGYSIRKVDTICHADSFVLNTGKYHGLTYVVLFSIGYVTGGSLHLSEEHDQARWCTLDELTDLDLTPETRRAISALSSRLHRYL